MLKLDIPETEFFNSETEEFIEVKAQTLTLEYSLVAISKWEQEYGKPFLKEIENNIPLDEMQDFIRCMTITQNVDPIVYKTINVDMCNKVVKYMEKPMTATTFSNEKPSTKKETVTNELVYYWMSALQIPFTPCEKWHFNRLMTLIKVASEKNQPPKKMSKGDILRQNNSLNAMRRAKYKSRG